MEQSWGLVTFATLITILTIENLDDNLCYLTINCDNAANSNIGISFFSV